MNDGERFVSLPASRRAFLASSGIFLSLPASVASARENGQERKETHEGAKERLVDMRRLAQRVKLQEIKGETPGAPVPLRTEPLHRYGDRARGVLDGTLWAWGERGRPAAILKVELWPDRDEGRGRWSLGVSASSPDRINVAFGDGVTWNSRLPGIELSAVPNAPVPAAGPAQRLAQAKAVARRLSAHGEHPRVTGRIDLRLLTTPIDRYADPGVGLVDGLIFAFVSATNPEALVFIEAWTLKPGVTSWRYGLARQGTTAVTVLNDGKVAWALPYAPPPSDTETYMNRSMPKGVELP